MAVDLNSLSGLLSLIQGGGAGANLRRPQPQSPLAGNLSGTVDATTEAPAPDLSALSGPSLQQGGIDYLNQVMPGDIAQRRQIALAAHDPHAEWNAANDAVMGSTDRNPAWSGFFGALRAKGPNAKVQYGGSGGADSTHGLTRLSGSVHDAGQ